MVIGPTSAASMELTKVEGPPEMMMPEALHEVARVGKSHPVAGVGLQTIAYSLSISWSFSLNPIQRSCPLIQ